MVTHHYLETHPWLTFDYQPIYNSISMRMGEAYSKCQHLIGTPLQPELAAELSSVYLVRGVLATTAIEGNTLSEDEAAAVLRANKRLPASMQYLEQGIRNVQKVLLAIDRASGNKAFRLSSAWLAEQNRNILANLEVAEHVVPGEYTKSTLIVGSVYRSPNPSEIPFLVEKLCDWINARLDAITDLPDDYRFFNTVTTAILAHLYLVWIHPFSDGNGRTARAVECAILAGSGLVPWVSSNLLSDFYNRTRARYYDKLSAASRKNDVHGFVEYALEGFVDMLREQIAEVQKMQHSVAWVNYIHGVFQNQTQGEATKRRRALALALPEHKDTPRVELRGLTPQIAQMYATSTDKMLSHDLNRLKELGLVTVTRKGIRPNSEVISAFLPAAMHPSLPENTEI